MSELKLALRRALNAMLEAVIFGNDVPVVDPFLPVFCDTIAELRPGDLGDVIFEDGADLHDVAVSVDDWLIQFRADRGAAQI